jgi:hypothetical protein
MALFLELCVVDAVKMQPKTQLIVYTNNSTNGQQP